MCRSAWSPVPYTQTCIRDFVEDATAGPPNPSKLIRWPRINVDTLQKQSIGATSAIVYASAVRASAAKVTQSGCRSSSPATARKYATRKAAVTGFSIA